MSLPPLKDYQVRGRDKIIAYLNEDPTNPILGVGPCVSGKSRIMYELTEWALANNRRVGVLAHRQMLLSQLADDFRETDTPFSVFAAGWGRYDRRQPVALMSASTVFSRCFRTGRQDLPDVDLLLVDEAHQQTGNSARAILYGAIKEGSLMDGYVFRGASVVGFTATPVMQGGLYGRRWSSVPTRTCVGPACIKSSRCSVRTRLTSRA
jgi:superfamily II DNA or RNA helicase